jgi:restriction system protein
MAYYDADKGLVVTNSNFTKNAEALAEANQVILWDRDVLVRLLAGEPMVGYVSELLHFY